MTVLRAVCSPSGEAGMSEFLEPPQHDLASHDVHALDGPDPAAARTAHAAAWDAAPDHESALLGPTLGDPGRGLDLGHLAIDMLENAVGGLPDQPHLALAQLDDVAGKQLADVDQRADLFGLGTGPAQVAQTAPSVLPKAAGPAKTAPPDRAAMLGQINAAGTKELVELDAGLQRQLTELDRTFAAEQKQLDGEVGTQERKTSGAASAGDSSLKGEIASQDRDNQKQIAAETTKNAREVTKQRATLGQAAESERGWHGVTRDQILTEDVNPHIATHVAAPRASGAPLASAATAIGAGKAIQGGNATRAIQATSIAGVQSGAILMKAELASQTLAADGEKLIATQNARTEATQHAITTEETKQGDRIQTQSTIANNEMEMHGTLAQARMEIERSGFTTQASDAAAGASGAMAAESTAGKTRGDALKAETATKIRSTHASAKAQVEAKVAKLRADLATTADVDLARRRRTMGKELASLDGSDQTVNAAMKRQAKHGESTLSAENDVRARRVRAEGAKARAAIATFVQDAKKRILSANKSTDRDIAGAAKRGRDAIHAVGADATKELVGFSEARHTKDVAAASKDLAGYDQKAANATMQLANMATGVATTIDKTWLDDALATTTKALDGDNFFGPTGDEATAGMRVLTGLPPHLQGDAIAKLSAEQFQNLLNEVPEGKREELAALVNNTGDPERKLQLWGTYHKAHVTADVAREKPGTDAESRRRHAARDTAAKGTLGEVDEEMAFMHQQVAKTGKALSITDVNDLIARKDTEHTMEMKYNVPFTTDGGARADGTHIHWDNDDLKALDKTFGRMPDAHLAGNAGLTDIHRQEKVFWDDAKTVEIGGVARGTSVLIPDQSTDHLPMGEKRQISDGSDISWLEWMMTHELGHNVSGKYGGAYAKYQQINGWQSHGADTDKLTDAQKAELDAKRGNGYQNRASVTNGDTTYQIDQDSGGYISRAQGSVPESGVAMPGPRSRDVDPWAYARTGGNEQFAEHYDRAMHVPDKVYADLVVNPHDATLRAQAELSAATTDAARVAAQEKVTRAQQAESVRKQSYDVMRNEIFGTKDAEAAAAARLTARGVDPTKMAEFTKLAAGASTPEQIAVLEAKAR